MSTSRGFQTYLQLMRYTRPYAVMLVVAVMATIGSSLVDASLTWMIKPLINQGLIAKEANFVKWLPLGVIGVMLLRGAMLFLSRYFMYRVSRSVVMVLRQQTFLHLLRLPAHFYDQRSSGILLSTITFNIEQVALATTEAFTIMLRSGFLVLGLIIVMFSVSWQLSLLFLTVTPAVLLIVRFATKRMRSLSSSIQDAMGEVAHIAEEGIEGYRVVRTYGGEQYEGDKFIAATRGHFQREIKLAITSTLSSVGVQLLVAIPVAITLYLVTSSYIVISAGSFAAVLTAMIALLNPLRQLTKVNSEIQRGIAGAKSIFELIAEKKEDQGGIETIEKAKGKIIFDNVSFAYPHTEKAILKNINLAVQPGKTIALVGASGSGKSSLVGLLPRFYDLTEGHIYLDDKPIQSYILSDLRHQFALVSQQITLFNDTIRNNIAYACGDNVTDEQVKHAAEMAYAIEFINNMPDGFDTLVGENGVLLSGGQRQRLAIARALLKDAPILILDEATSALDTKSERHIQKALDVLMKSRTTIVIAHRLSTVEKADLIYVLDQGCVVESGTHQQLLDFNAHYARLHALQFQGQQVTSSA